ncbi:site-specific integrase [Alicyclobacillus sp. ALC3]|uniref:site-specific integrase n=1 Tax=Alicyclobacillus sp. ALC3 TaxID=2796143 RepID=UPI0023797492|nr:site-specific integrase [Alicyclobacillus sp. ALC3]
MAIQLHRTVTVEVSTEIEQLTAGTEEFQRQSRIASTQKAYKSDWEAFTTWCDRLGYSALPAAPQAVSNYLTHLSQQGRRVSTIARHMASISFAHRAKGLPSPIESEYVRSTWKGIRHQQGVAAKQKAPILTEHLRRMVQVAPDNLRGLRDRALLLVGFAGAFRRSELVALDVEDLEMTQEGITITIRRSKTDQEGYGRKVGIPYGSRPETCPVRTLQEWLKQADIASGAVFRRVDKAGRVGVVVIKKEGKDEHLSDRTVARIVKHYAEAIGLPSESYAGHSLRSGLATSAAKAGASMHSIMNQTGHKGEAMVRRYIRYASLYHDNAATYVGL